MQGAYRPWLYARQHAVTRHAAVKMNDSNDGIPQGQSFTGWNLLHLQTLCRYSAEQCPQQTAHCVVRPGCLTLRGNEHSGCSRAKPLQTVHSSVQCIQGAGWHCMPVQCIQGAGWHCMPLHTLFCNVGMGGVHFLMGVSQQEAVHSRQGACLMVHNCLCVSLEANTQECVARCRSCRVNQLASSETAGAHSPAPHCWSQGGVAGWRPCCCMQPASLLWHA